MRWLETLPITLTPLSPIHIGTGVELDWMQAVITPQPPCVNIFTPEQASRALPIVASAELPYFENIKHCRQFFQKHALKLASIAQEKVVLLPKLASYLQDQLGRNNVAHDRVLQNMFIQRLIRDTASHNPVLYGSSLKGTLRTAWLDSLATDNNREDDDKGQRYQKKLFGYDKVNEDPFRQIKVADAYSKNPLANVVLEAANYGRRSDKPKLPVYLEAMVPLPDMALQGELRRQVTDKELTAISLPELLKQAHHFHMQHWQALALDKHPCCAHWWSAAMGELLPQLALERGAILLRVGKLATAESKTTRHRHIKVKIGTEFKNLPHGTTFWLAGDRDDQQRLPFGWLLLEFGEQHSAVQAGKNALLDACKKYAPWRDWQQLNIEPLTNDALPSTSSTDQLFVKDKVKQDLLTNMASVDYLKSSIKQHFNNSMYNDDDKKALYALFQAIITDEMPELSQRLKHHQKQQVVSILNAFSRYKAP